MDDHKTEIDNKRRALEAIIKENGGCSCINCPTCPLRFYLKREDGAWMSCSGVVETMFGASYGDTHWIKTAEKILGELEIDEMLRGYDD